MLSSVELNNRAVRNDAMHGTSFRTDTHSNLYRLHTDLNLTAVLFAD